MLDLIKTETLDARKVFRLKQIAERIFSNVNRIGTKNRIVEFYYSFLVPYLTKIKRIIKGYQITRKVPHTCEGLTVAFIGQDGAGKSTVTNDIAKWWGWKLDARLTYLGSGDNYYSWRKKLLDIIPNNILFKIPRAWLSLTKYTHLASDVLKNIKCGEQYADRGGLQIYDRYPQIDYYGLSDGPKIGHDYLSKFPSIVQPLLAHYAKKEKRLLSEAASFHPDIVFKLVLSPEESLRRKPKEKVELVKQKHDIINSLKFEGSEVYTIDAALPYEEEIRLIKKIIWEHIRK